MNRKSDQKRKRTELEMLGSSSESDVEILDYKPEVKRVRTTEPVPLLEDLANGNIEPNPQRNPETNLVQNGLAARQGSSLLTTPNGSSDGSESENEIIEINDDESEDEVENTVFHDENPNVDEDNSAILISDSDSEPPSPEVQSPVSDDVIEKGIFRRRISSGKKFPLKIFR